MRRGRLRLVTYGGFRLIRRGGHPARLRGRKIEALCAHLVLTGEAARESLRLLLWGKSGARAGRHSLSQTLSQLHAQLAVFHERPVVTRHDIVSLAPELIRADLHAVERLLRRNSPDSLRVARALCGGDFLAGMQVDSPAFDAWLATERVRGRALAFETQWRHTMGAIAGGRTVDALLSAFRLIELDALNERGHLLLMTLYAEQGRVGEALRQYDTCARLLEAAFHREPGAAVRELRRQLLSPAALTG